MFESMFLSLILTIILELLLAILIKIKNKESLLTIIWVNCLKNPIVVYITNISLLTTNNIVLTNTVLAFLEIAVVFVEGYLFKKYLKRIKISPYMFSLYLNGLSFSLGLLLSHIF